MEYQYVLELFREDDSPVGQARIDVDWEPAGEWTRFAALRQGALSEGDTARVVEITPLWHQEIGEPMVTGFRVNLAVKEQKIALDFTTDYFANLVLQASAAFIERGALTKGERIRYLASAFPERSQVAPTPALAFTVEEVAPVLHLAESHLDAFVEGAKTLGQIDTADAPAFIPEGVLEEAAALARQSGAMETGGVLIGRLHRDPDRAEAFIEVTAQIPARHVEADLTSLSFTEETWTDVQAAIALRRRQEIWLGWWHSHPLREWCKECPVDRQNDCRMAKDFFSAHDRHLHRTVFPRAYSIALVANDTATKGVTFSAFGWRRGVIEPRGVYVRS